MSFDDTPGFVRTPGMNYPFYRFNVSGVTDTNDQWSTYFVVCNYPGAGTYGPGDAELLGAIKAAVEPLTGVTGVEVVRYAESTEDVTSTLPPA